MNMTKLMHTCYLHVFFLQILPYVLTLCAPFTKQYVSFLPQTKTHHIKTT